MKTMPWWLWAHALGLDAPLVAVLWQRMLAHAHGVQLTPMLDTGLALACWVVLVLDDTLGNFTAKQASGPGLRRAFFLCHRRVLLHVIVPTALVLLAWIAFYVIPEGVLWQAAGMSLLVALYLSSWTTQTGRMTRDLLISCAGLGGIFLISHLPAPPGFRLTLSVCVLAVMVISFLRQIGAQISRLLPREIAAALLFALGCSTGTRFFAMPETISEPLLECLLLASPFACGLHGIACLKQGQPRRRHFMLVLIALLLTLGVLWLDGAGGTGHNLRTQAHVVLGALVLHLGIWRVGGHLAIDAHRVLAILALILPLPLAWL